MSYIDLTTGQNVYHSSRGVQESSTWALEFEVILDEFSSTGKQHLNMSNERNGVKSSNM